MHPGALPSCFLLEPRALPADAERVVDSVALDAHDAPAGRAPNRDCVRAEAIAYVLRPDDVLNRASIDLGEPAALGTGDHRACVAASWAEASFSSGLGGGQRALESGLVGRPAVRRKHVLDRQLEERPQPRRDLLPRHSRGEPPLVDLEALAEVYERVA